MAIGTAALIGGALSIGGSILGGIGGARGRSAERDQFKRQQKSLRRQIGQTREMFGMKLDQFDQQAGSFLSTQQQRIGLSGVSTEGSPLLVQAEAQENLAQDRSMLELKRDMQVGQLRDEMKGVKRARKTSRRSEPWAIGASVFGGASSALGTASGLKGFF